MQVTLLGRAVMGLFDCNLSLSNACPACQRRASYDEPPAPAVAAPASPSSEAGHSPLPRMPLASATAVATAVVVMVSSENEGIVGQGRVDVLSGRGEASLGIACGMQQPAVARAATLSQLSSCTHGWGPSCRLRLRPHACPTAGGEGPTLRMG